MAKKSTRQDLLPRIPGKLRRLARDVETELHHYRRVNGGVKTPSTHVEKRAAARKFNPLLLARDFAIKKHAHLSDPQICGMIDMDLQWRDGPTVGLPQDWIESFNLRSFSEAYEDPDFRPLVQKMIAKAKKRVFDLP